MAVITVNFADIGGESSLVGYEGWLDAVAIRDSIEMPLVSGSGRTRGGRTSGTSNHSDIELTRFKDIATPKLMQACSGGINVGAVVIHIFRMLETGLVPYMTFKLTDTFVSRVETATLDENGGAFEPHMSESSINTLPASVGAGGVVLTELRKGTGRISVRPVAYQTKAAYTNQEVERTYLNPASVTWEYAKYVAGVSSGSVVKGWNVELNTEAA